MGNSHQKIILKVPFERELNGESNGSVINEG